MAGEEKRMKLVDRPCAICSSSPTTLVRERVAGSRGAMAQSFVGHYRLCQGCLDRVEAAKGICAVEDARRRTEKRVTVAARTFAWLKATAAA